MDALSSSSGDLPAPTRPLAGPPLIDSAPDTVAVELMVFRICHITLMPLRWLSRYVSRSRRASAGRA
ncbi:MAG: hypothetical protein J5X22_20960 [Candidatus Accumulibacter sp.]|uniref:hypothetical protein n=1 Tax=Accumulibacter sp. TaxID=2053492 RepID=UPI001AD2D5D5|nr:hypothetical protein [Accumulibacter sp.]MBN8516623.1 hypothetical protein [Accumulibacter sp.]MBO3712865.1 hypothetical protein [Accumulibacter sp.]